MAGPNDKRLVELSQILTLLRTSNFHTNDTNSDDKRIAFGDVIKHFCSLILSADYNSSSLQTLVLADAIDVKKDSTKETNTNKITLNGSVINDYYLIEDTIINPNQTLEVSYPPGFTQSNTYVTSLVMDETPDGWRLHDNVVLKSSVIEVTRSVSGVNQDFRLSIWR